MPHLCYKCRQPVGQPVHGLHSECFADWFAGGDLDFTDLAVKPPDTVDGRFASINSSFFHGKFRKYSASLGKHAFILKVQQLEYPELPAMEYLCNQIAESVGLELPPFDFIDLMNGAPTFVVKNFMATGRAQSLVHIYHFLSSPADFNCETLYEIVASKTQRAIDAEKLIDITLFDALIGNHDRHGRNLGLIQSSGGYRLAPAYDNPSYLGVEEEWLLPAQHAPRGAIATHATREPVMSDYVEEWKRLGHGEAVAEFQRKVKLGNIEKLVNQSFISIARRDALLRLIKSRFLQLKGAGK